jgi:hypothetical protein
VTLGRSLSVSGLGFGKNKILSFSLKLKRLGLLRGRGK